MNLRRSPSILFITTLISACGHSSGSSSDSGSSFSGNMQNITGTITSLAGSASQMKSWAVALFEHDTGLARVALADGSGSLSWSMVSLDQPQTAVLMSPDFLLQSLTALPSDTAKTVKQFFYVNGTSIPQIVQNGAGLSFQNQTGLTIASYTAIDSNGVGLPDGVKKFTSSSLTLNQQTKQQPLNSLGVTQKGIHKGYAQDIDGDGLMNGIDPDDDGDGVLDIFDTDQNGNGIPDSQETTTDQYYAQGLDYFAAKFELGPSANTMLFVAKVKDGVTPSSVSIRAASSLITNATVIANDGSTSNWDGTLTDDGNNSDGAAKDKIYGRKIQLSSGTLIRANQVVFANITIGSGSSAFTVEYPFLFPNVTLSAITAANDASSGSNVVTLSGNPFGASIQSFVWNVEVFDSNNLKVYEAPLVSGSTRTLTIPSNVLVTGSTYTVQAVAQSFAKVPGVPALAVRSAAITIND